MIQPSKQIDFENFSISFKKMRSLTLPVTIKKITLNIFLYICVCGYASSPTHTHMCTLKKKL